MERTEVNISTSFSKIEIQDNLIFLGSCFSDNIGGMFKNHKLHAIVNPFGVVFHPIALSRLIKRALNKRYFEAKDFFEFEDYWFSYELPGPCAQFTIKESLDFANNSLDQLRNEICSGDKLFITFGSSIERSLDGLITANCHKQQKGFFKRSLTPSIEIEEDYLNLFKSLNKLNPDLKIHLTVSPVRHSKEGLVDNNRSKASLLIACQRLEEQFDFVEYLPIYELVIDELRDYSFFKEDLVHPSLKAINTIYDRILIGLANPNLQEYVVEVKKLLNAINHKSLHPRSENNISFLKKTLSQIEIQEQRFNTSWESEKADVKNRLINMA